MVHLLRVSRRLSLCVSVQCYSVNVSYWRLEFGHVSLVHTVMSDQLIWAGEFLLTARPVTVKGFLTWRTEQTWHVKVLICNRMNSSKTRVWEKKGLRTCFTCMSPCVGLQMIGAGKLSFACLALKGFDSYNATENTHTHFTYVDVLLMFFRRMTFFLNILFDTNFCGHSKIPSSIGLRFI